MKWIKKYEYFKESINNKYGSKSLISEICTAMVVLNNEFLDKILDMGLRARYTENSQVFVTDLKNLLLSKNRLKLGKFVEGKCVEDEEISKINNIFQQVEFSIEKDFNTLVDSRITARNIIDKLIPGEKLRPEMVRNIYWIGPNKSKDFSEDIVIELETGEQFSFFLNKNITSQKSASFATFMDDLIGNEIENLYSGFYIDKWNKLVQSWMKILYENVNKNMQVYINKFISSDRLETIDWFNYFNVRHSDPQYQYLGEHIKELGKNILWLSDLMNEIWKNRDTLFEDPDKVYKEWMEVKTFTLNSRILEHIITESLSKNNKEDITKLESGFKKSSGKTKMKFLKTIVEKMGCLEREVFYLGTKGNDFQRIPSREFFRKNYENIDIEFDYHVKMLISSEEERNDFTIKVNLKLNEKDLLKTEVQVKFSGGISEKLTAKYKFYPVSNFNMIIKEVDRNANEIGEKISESLLNISNNIDYDMIETIEKNIKEGSKILEISCGNSQDALFLKKSFEITCTEINDSYIENALYLGLKCIKHDTRQEFPFKNNEFDLIYSRLGLHYFTEVELLEILKDIKRIGKKILISVKIEQDEINTGKIILTKENWYELINTYWNVKIFEELDGYLYGKKSKWLKILGD